MSCLVNDIPLVSVVVPVYNTKPERLLACIRSLEVQTSHAFELIVVDDGSEDIDCLYALDDVERKLPNAKIVHIMHQGVSVARNMGVASSKGDYILFVDSDDQIPPHMIERGQKAIIESGCDVVLGYVQYITSAHPPIERSDNHPIFVSHNANDLLLYHLRGADKHIKEHLPDGAVLKIGPVARLVKAELARELPFPVGVRISEDTLWSIDLFLHTNRVAVVEDIWYWYFRGGQSASSGMNEFAAQDAGTCLRSLFRTLNGHEEALPREAVLARILGEISRVAKRWYSRPECPLSYIDCMKEMNGLLDSYPDVRVVKLKTACLGGPVLLVKYALCRSGLLILYWKMRNTLGN